MGWIRICDKNSLNDGDIKEFDHNDIKILITMIRDKIYATDRICTHAYADL
jgi:nitrite reductase/ring-hydroxylating ferredoxin subunit